LNRKFFLSGKQIRFKIVSLFKVDIFKKRMF
jgi:hypothetical protein